MIDITGNMSFANGLTSVGFGSSDVLVRRVWVLILHTRWLTCRWRQCTARRILGKRDIRLSGILAAGSVPDHCRRPNLPVIEPTLINAIWLPTARSRSIVSLFGSNLAAPNQGGATTILTLNDQPVKILYASPLQINLIVPASLQPGPRFCG